MRNARTILLVLMTLGVSLSITACSGGNSPNAPTPVPTQTFHISTSALPAAVVGQDYNSSLSAENGNAPYSWEVVNGNLPMGIVLQRDGHFSGRTTDVSPRQFTVRATDTSGKSDSKMFGLTVALAQVDCPSQPEWNESGIHFKILLKPACGSVLKVNSIPPFKVEMKHSLGGIGYFGIGLTQSPLGTTPEQISPLSVRENGDIYWPWVALSTKREGLPSDQLVVADLAAQGILSPGINAGQMPNVTYLLVTFQRNQGFGWKGFGQNACPWSDCNIWQAAIVLDAQIVP
jgi:hypothetical protein